MFADSGGGGAIGGKGGRKSGMWEGGCQLAVRARLREGDNDGLEMGESGRGGMRGRGIAVFGTGGMSFN